MLASTAAIALPASVDDTGGVSIKVVSPSVPSILEPKFRWAAGKGFDCNECGADLSRMQTYCAAEVKTLGDVALENYSCDAGDVSCMTMLTRVRDVAKSDDRCCNIGCGCLPVCDDCGFPPPPPPPPPSPPPPNPPCKPIPEPYVDATLTKLRKYCLFYKPKLSTNVSLAMPMPTATPLPSWEDEGLLGFCGRWMEAVPTVGGCYGACAFRAEQALNVSIEFCKDVMEVMHAQHPGRVCEAACSLPFKDPCQAPSLQPDDDEIKRLIASTEKAPGYIANGWMSGPESWIDGSLGEGAGGGVGEGGVSGGMGGGGSVPSPWPTPSPLPLDRDWWRLGAGLRSRPRDDQIDTLTSETQKILEQAEEDAMPNLGKGEVDFLRGIESTVHGRSEQYALAKSEAEAKARRDQRVATRVAEREAAKEKRAAHEAHRSEDAFTRALNNRLTRARNEKKVDAGVGVGVSAATREGRTAGATSLQPRHQGANFDGP